MNATHQQHQTLKPQFTYYLLGERSAVMQSISTHIDLDCQRLIWAIAQKIQTLRICIDVVPGMNNLTLVFDPIRHPPQAILAKLEELAATTEVTESATRHVQIPVKYGAQYGPDLAIVADHCQLSADEVIQLHSEANYLVYFLGFQPGFAYLGGLNPQLATPRRTEPRTRIEAGSVGIGGNQTGIYPAASPGGWQIIGHTSLRLFDPHRSSASLLQPGDTVSFIVEG